LIKPPTWIPIARGSCSFARNLLVKVPKGTQDMLAAAAALMGEAREDVLAFRGFPPEHWRKIWSTKPLEWLNVAPRGALSEAADQTPPPGRRHRPERRAAIICLFVALAAGAAGGVVAARWRRVFSEQSMAKLDCTTVPGEDHSYAAPWAAA
jgi:hypothetical protein